MPSLGGIRPSTGNHRARRVRTPRRLYPTYRLQPDGAFADLQPRRFPTSRDLGTPFDPAISICSGFPRVTTSHPVAIHCKSKSALTPTQTRDIANDPYPSDDGKGRKKTIEDVTPLMARFVYQSCTQLHRHTTYRLVRRIEIPDKPDPAVYNRR